MSLGDFIADLLARVENGSSPDACVLCGSTTALLHPVGRAWACSRCHDAATPGRRHAGPGVTPDLGGSTTPPPRTEIP
jgi:hypothetical protein